MFLFCEVVKPKEYGVLELTMESAAQELWSLLYAYVAPACKRVGAQGLVPLLHAREVGAPILLRSDRLRFEVS